MWKWSILSLSLLVGGVAGMVVTPLVNGRTAAPTNASAKKEFPSYRDIVKKVLPGVVSIETKPVPVVRTKQPAQKRQPFANEPQIPEEFRKFLQPFEGRQFEMPEPGPQHAFGSGFVVDSKGVILTNYHVVQGADQVVVKLEDGRQFVTRDIKSDPKTDLAIVRVKSDSPLPALDLGDSSAMEIGDRVLAVGAPFGLTGSVTAGIISARGRSLHMNMYEDFLQTDAAINPGNSGGPLVNMNGQVIGINTAIKSSSGGSQGVGLAVASNLAHHIMDQLLKNGVVHRGYLGIQIRPLEPDVAVRLGVENKTGVVVSQVFDGMPAAKAGLKAGDVITTVAGKRVKNGGALQSIVAALPTGKPVDVSVTRDGKPMTMHVTVEEQPQEYGTTNNNTPETPKHEKSNVMLDKIGVELQDMTPERASQLGFKEKASGALVARVEDDSIAADAGLQHGMLIVKVDKAAVHSASEARDALAKGSLEKGILVEVRSAQNGVNYLMLKSSATK